MYSRWSLVQLGSITRFQDEKRRTLSPRQCAGQPGEYPYYGPRGIIARIDSYAYEGEYLLVTESPRGNGGAGGRGGVRAVPVTDDSSPRSPAAPVPPALAVPVNGRFSTSTHVHVLRCDRETDPRFLCRLLNAIPRPALPRFLGRENLAALEIFLPPPEDQRHILTAMLNIERKITLVQDQNRVLRGILQSLFDHHFIFGGGSPRPLGDFVEYRNLDPVPGSGPVPGPAAGNGTAFHNLLLYPRQDLHPLFTGILAANPEFRTHAESCREHRGGKQRLNGELLMAFELTGPAKTPGETPFPSGCYREFNQTAGAAEKKFAANHAELRVLEQLRQSLFPPYGGF